MEQRVVPKLDEFRPQLLLVVERDNEIGANLIKEIGVLYSLQQNESAAITLFGNYVAAGFHIASDGAAGTAVTYTQAATAHLELAPPAR